MKNKRIKWSLSLFILVTIFYQTSNAATGGAFLKLPVGVKSIGMGGANSALTPDASSIATNPASLAFLKRPEISLMHSEWIAQMKYEFIGFVNPTKIGSFGASLIYLSSGEMEKRGEDRSLQGSFTSYNLAMSFAYSNKLSEVLSFGTNIKYIRMAIEEENANGIGFDIGLFYEEFNPLKLAFVVQNIGPNMKFINESFNLPTTAILGISYSLDFLTFAMDIKKVVWIDKLSVSFGIECVPVNLIALRIGYLSFGLLNRETIYSSSSSVFESFSGFSGGIGLNISDYSLDYAFVPYGILGNTHRFSLLIKF